MSEKTTLLPSAPSDIRFGDAPQPAQVDPAPCEQYHTNVQMPRIILVPGLEFDPARKYRYGMHSLVAALMILLSFILIELRNCNGGPGIDLDRLQALHVSLLVFAFVLYLLSLFGIADFIFQYKLMFFLGVLTIYTFVGLMVWMTFEAAVNPCVKNINFIPVDLSNSKNVFTRGDGVGIVVLILDIFATILMFSAAGSFYKRY